MLRAQQVYHDAQIVVYGAVRGKGETKMARKTYNETAAAREVDHPSSLPNQASYPALPELKSMYVNDSQLTMEQERAGAVAGY